MQVGALTVGQASGLIATILVADGITGVAASEDEVCAAPEESTGDDTTLLQLVLVLLAVGAILGALTQQMIVMWLGVRRPATREAAVQTDRERRRNRERADREEVDQREAPMRADRSLQTDPLHVNAYWAMPLHEVRAVALKREVPNAATSTRVQLAGESIRMDFATVH